MKTKAAAPHQEPPPRNVKSKKLKASLLAACLALPFSANGAGMLIAEGGFGGELDIVEHTVEVMINNGIAVTTVEQTFRNKENRIVEALYTFPVPKGASVSNFAMDINGKEMIGEVVEKKRAREIYESYKKKRVDPGLLEQVDYRSFEMRIFPIAANADQHVRVTYAQEMEYDHDRGIYVYPLATRTKKGIDSRVDGKFAISFHLSSEVPVTDVTSPSHEGSFITQKHSDSYWEASLEQPDGSIAEDVVLSWDMARPKTGLDLITSATKREDGYFLMTLTVGEDLERFDEGMDYVFVLDISGSMQHQRKFPISRKSIDAFIDALGEKDRFDVLTFNIATTAKFNQLTTPDEQSVQAAYSFLSSQQARGGTRLLPAIQAAYRYADADRTLNVIVVSDGMSEEQAARAELISAIRQRPANARVFCVGVGNDINRPLLEQAAQTSGGLASFISEGDDFEAQAKAFRRKLTRPAATDLAISIDGVDAYDIEPKTLPNLYHGAPLRVYGRYRGDGKAEVSLSGLVRGKPLKVSKPLRFDPINEANPEIERMWACKRIDGLLKEADEKGSREPVRDEIVRLGEGYSIVTEFTSFLVLENDSEYKRWNIERRNQLRTNRDRGAQQDLRLALQKMREQGVNQVNPQLAEEVPTTTKTTAPTVTQQQPQVRPQPAPAPTPRRSSDRRIDFNIGGGGGSGPVGPVLLLLTGARWWSRKKQAADSDQQ